MSYIYRHDPEHGHSITCADPCSIPINGCYYPGGALLWIKGRSPNWPFYTDRNRDRYEAEAARHRSSKAFARA